MKICFNCKKQKSIKNFHKDKYKKDELCTWCKECRSRKSQKYYLNNKSKIIKQQIFYKRFQYNTNVDYKIKKLLRDRIRLGLKGVCKSKTMIKLLGCSIEKLKKHLESKFKDSMSWSNYGKWHIDHIRPCASFDLSKLNEQKKCFNWKNLQPLWAGDNLRKNKYQ